MAISHDNDINPSKKLDWIGKLGKKDKKDEDSCTSSDNQQSGSVSAEQEQQSVRKTKKKKPGASIRGTKAKTGQNKSSEEQMSRRGRRPK